MIIGIGTDIVFVGRIRKIYESDKKDIFLEKIFTPKEIELAENHKDPVLFFSGRWATKEAVSKALGTGIGHECAWKDMEILSLESGAPNMSISGTALITAKKMNIQNWHVSISHEKTYAISYVIAESLD